MPPKLFLTITCKRTIFSVEIHRSTLNHSRQLLTSISKPTSLFFERNTLLIRNTMVGMFTFVVQKYQL